MCDSRDAIPDGHYFKDDLDGGRLIKKDIASKAKSIIEEIQQQGEQLRSGLRCPKCGGHMGHYRLDGYRCMGGCR